MQQANTLGGAARFANRARVHADDLAVLADQHDFRILGDLRDAYDLAVALSGLNVDHTGAAASLETIFVCRRTLAKAVLRDRQNERALDRHGFIGGGSFWNSGFHLSLLGIGLGFLGVLRGRSHTDDVVAFVEIHAAHTVGWPSHRAHIVFVKTDGLAVVRSQEDDLIAVGEGGTDQFVVLVDADGDDAARHHVGEVL